MPPSDLVKMISPRFKGIELISNSETNQILEFPRPQPVVPVERVLVGHSLEPGDFLFLRENFRGCVIQDGFYWCLLSAITVHCYGTEAPVETEEK